MNVYTRVLEFFMENGVQLNMEQMEDLKAICETRAHGYTVMRASETRGINSTFRRYAHRDYTKDLKGQDFDKVERYTRQIDLLNNKLKRGEIDKEEFEDKYKAIEDKAGELSSYLSKDGSQSVSDKYYHGRPKDKDGNPIKNPKNKDVKLPDDPPEGVKEKIERHYALANSTDNPKETLSEKEKIEKYSNIGKSKSDNRERDIRVDIDNSNNKIYTLARTPYNGEKGHKTNQFSEDDKLTHTTALDNVNKLKPSARSKEGIIYGDERVYVTKNEGQKASLGGFRGTNKYEIDPKVANKLPATKSTNPDDYYLSTDKSIEVKKDTEDDDKK